jgi:signal transduction histidine kinase
VLAASPAVDRAAVALALVVGAVGTAIVVASAPGVLDLDPVTLLFLTGLVLAARLRTLDLFDRSSFSISVVPVFAAGMLLGVTGAATVALVSGLAHGVARRLAWYKVVFNCGNYVTAAAAAAAVFHLFGAAFTPANLPVLLAAAAAAGLAHYGHTFVTAFAIATDRRGSPSEVWAEHFAWMWPQYAPLGVMALLLALAYHQFGLAGAAAFVAPPVMMLYTTKQYIDRTTESVRQLRGLNSELTGLNADLAREIRQREAAEEEKARLAHQAARAAALEELSRLKSQFISVASHELRTPLTSVVGYTELVLADTPDDDPRHGMLSITHRCAQQLAGLVDNLLDASRIEAGQLSVQPTEVELEPTIALVLEVVGASAPKHALVAAVSAEAGRVRADPDRLRQILTNLVGNAVTYSPAGGQVLVAARAAAEGWVELSVSDQGLGIPPEELDRIFDPYQRVNAVATRRIKGTGLGLYIVRHLVELHGGTIRVESVLGRGSTFVVSLPTVAPAGPGAHKE